MINRLIVMLLFGIALLAGCSGEKGKEQIETAQFEEKQGNREHATKLYSEIIQKYPGSENAKMAEARLAEMNKTK